jgi:hypothetical protein
MNGRVVALGIVAAALIAGAGVWYAQVWGYYHEVAPQPGRDVMLVARDSGVAEPIPYSDFHAIDADSSPIRYRACFVSGLEPGGLNGNYIRLDGAMPRTGPGWFDCFDAAAIAAELEAGTARAYLGIRNVAYGVDRIVALTDDGRGYAWHDLNDCGKKSYDGTPVGDACPPRPEPATD